MGSDELRSLVVRAANGARVEVLYEGAATATLVRIFGGLLQDDFTPMCREIRQQGSGSRPALVAS